MSKNRSNTNLPARNSDNQSVQARKDEIQARAVSSDQVSEVRVSRANVELHEGPLPDPKTLGDYKTIDPELVRVVVAMAEREQGQRHGFQTTALVGEIERQRRGQIFGLVVALAGLTVAGVLGVMGKEAAAGVIATIDLVGLTSVFLYGEYLKRTSGD